MGKDINSMSPTSGRSLAEDGSVINLTDLAVGKVVTFHDAVSATGNGYTHITNGYKTLTLSCIGDNTSRTIEVHAVDANGVDHIVPGISVVDWATLSTLTIKNLSVQYSVEGMYSVYAKITALAGGNATIKGELTS